jgi:hypothetical protein
VFRNVRALGFTKLRVVLRIAVYPPEQQENMRRLMNPVAAKLQRQPTFSRAIPISGTPMAKANLAAESKMAVAKQRSLGGNQWPIAFAFAGKVGASPTPSRNRAAKNPPRLGVMAAPKEAMLQRKVLIRPIRRMPKAIQQDSDRKLADSVGPVVGAGEIAESNIGDAETGNQRDVRDRQVHPVEIVDQHAERQEPRDAQAALGRPEWTDRDHKFWLTNGLNVVHESRQASLEHNLGSIRITTRSTLLTGGFRAIARRIKALPQRSCGHTSLCYDIRLVNREKLPLLHYDTAANDGGVHRAAGDAEEDVAVNFRVVHGRRRIIVHHDHIC